MKAAGVAGVRLNLIGPDAEAQLASWDTPQQGRVAALGWQIEVQAHGLELPRVLDRLDAFDGSVVVDPFGRPAGALEPRHPGFRRLLEAGPDGKLWVKLSAAYRLETPGPAPLCRCASRPARPGAPAVGERLALDGSTRTGAATRTAWHSSRALPLPCPAGADRQDRPPALRLRADGLRPFTRSALPFPTGWAKLPRNKTGHEAGRRRFPEGGTREDSSSCGFAAASRRARAGGGPGRDRRLGERQQGRARQRRRQDGGEPPPDTVSIIDLSACRRSSSPRSGAGERRRTPRQRRGRARRELRARHLRDEGRSGRPDQMAPDDKLTVIDLKSSPPKVVQTVTVGKGAAGVSINKAGTLALVANRSEGTVSVLAIAAARSREGEDQARRGQLRPEPAGIHAGRHRWRSSPATTTTRSRCCRSRATRSSTQSATSTPGLRPYQVDITGSGEVAIVANIGLGRGDADTISVIDLKAKPPRVVNTVTVGQTPEGLKMSPDGRYVAVTVMNGSNKPKDRRSSATTGLSGSSASAARDLTHVAELKVGHWCQGAAWSKDAPTRSSSSAWSRRKSMPSRSTARR